MAVTRLHLLQFDVGQDPVVHLLLAHGHLWPSTAAAFRKLTLQLRVGLAAHGARCRRSRLGPLAKLMVAEDHWVPCRCGWCIWDAGCQWGCQVRVRCGRSSQWLTILIFLLLAVPFFLALLFRNNVGVQLDQWWTGTWKVWRQGHGTLHWELMPLSWILRHHVWPRISLRSSLCLDKVRPVVC